MEEGFEGALLTLWIVLVDHLAAANIVKKDAIASSVEQTIPGLSVLSPKQGVFLESVLSILRNSNGSETSNESNDVSKLFELIQGGKQKT